MRNTKRVDVGCGYSGCWRLGCHAQSGASAPSKSMITARGVARNSQRAHFDSIFEKGHTTPKDVNASDTLPFERIILCTVLVRATRIGDRWIDWIAFLQTVQAATRLHRAVEVCSGNDITVDTESIRRIGFLNAAYFGLGILKNFSVMTQYVNLRTHVRKST